MSVLSEPASVADIDTPALLVDVDRLEGNIARMASFFSDRPGGLRPHFKTPKCAEIVRMQLDAGAIGITCAKVGEIEALAESGVATSVLLANQVVGERKIARLLDVARSMDEVIVAVDAPGQVDAIDAAVRSTDVSLGAVIEVDVGMERCGTDSPLETVELARHIRESSIEYRGVMGYEGHAVLIEDAAERRKLTDEAMARLGDHCVALSDAGLAPQIVSSSGTGTFDMAAAHPFVTEFEAGSYVFMDGRYRTVRTDFDTALTLLTTVIHRRGRKLITDGGMKSLSYEFGMPRGATLPVQCLFLAEEHGTVIIDDGVELDIGPGDRIELVPSHSDTTINLHDRYYACRADQVEAVWAITGRGRFV